ncbi:MAG: 23S rRNA (adenine(1618)-N(6))-methyltransferase RlmF [Bacteroidia bacterium]|nr:23S rRNA (adenine(1618)-N(6))-methyltransferase RlmF [Bacteroidia bacterium]
MEKKREHPAEKTTLHPRSRHRARYDFAALIQSCPALAPFVVVNQYGDESVNFFDPEAVKMLNKALLKQHYGIDNWDVPQGYLCPPIPGRADYLHHLADLLAEPHQGAVPKAITCLDIGVGANCIYPLIGFTEYGWSFIGTDIDPVAIESAQRILDANPPLGDHVKLRLQANPADIFRGALEPGERIDLSICNPPFHASLEEAMAGTSRKLRNLTKSRKTETIQNFGGMSNELWSKGGEKRFVTDMIYQSKGVGKACRWFSTLISKESNLKAVEATLQKVDAKQVRIIPMGHGNKKSRIAAWTFFTETELNRPLPSGK